jgi:hypothetical protein
MPCGGIYPINGSWLANTGTQKYPCFHCNKPDCDLWCEEWDAPIHSACVSEFLTGPEGQIVLAHGHKVTILKDGEEIILHDSEEENC